MSGLGFIFRTILALGAFLMLCLYWAGVPYLDKGIALETTFLSVFFGTQPPSGTVRDLILLSRFLLGLGVTLYIFIPGLRYLFEFNAKSYGVAAAQLLGLATVGVFFAALVIQHVFYL